MNQRLREIRLVCVISIALVVCDSSEAQSTVRNRSGSFSRRPASKTVKLAQPFHSSSTTEFVTESGADLSHEPYGTFETSGLRNGHKGIVPKHQRGTHSARHIVTSGTSFPRIMPIEAEQSIVQDPEPIHTEEDSADGQSADGAPTDEFITEEWIEGDGAGICGQHGCMMCCLPIPCLNLENFTIFGGVQGFKNPSNLGRDGSFGFHQGFNWSIPMKLLLPSSGLGLQVGLRATQSDLSGADFTNETRNQLFFTTGVFRRADWGLQGGVVFDYLRDDWYDKVDIGQARGELSWMYPCQHEWGFTFSTDTDNDVSVSPLGSSQQILTWEANDLYAFFYRRRFDELPGGEGRILAGFTGGKGGLLGLDASLPISSCCSFEGMFTYVIPEQSRHAGGNEHEGWNVGISLVWHPGFNARPHGISSYYRPLFRVADNGSFVQRRR